MISFMSHFLPSCHVSPHYRRLLDELGPEHPLRRTVDPLDDRSPTAGELADPLGEEVHSPCPGLVHTYPDKVLLLVTLDCATHCQYCTRGRMVNQGMQVSASKSEMLTRWIQVLGEQSDVRDVLISGGDPLVLSDDEL